VGINERGNLTFARSILLEGKDFPEFDGNLGEEGSFPHD